MIGNFYTYQILIFTIAFIFIFRTFVLMLQGKKSWRELVLALVVWGFAAIVALTPTIFDLIAKLTGFQFGLNAILVFVMIVLTYFILRFTLRHDKMENSITRLVRQEALKDLREEVQRKQK